MYIHGVEINIINEQLDTKEIKDGQYNIIEFNEIEASGEKPVEGMIEIEEGKIVDYSLKIGNYVVNYDVSINKPIISEEVRKAEPNVYLVEGMTAVKYENNKWTVVDSSKRDWYNYNNQEWANAVILNTGVTKNIGDTIDVSNEVKGMLVYIPRYEYKIEGKYGKGGISVEQPGEIEINFITNRVTKASEGYRVHPGFKFGEEELNGIWVGKFETTGTGESPTILPSVSSLRSQNISTQFATSQKFNSYITNGDSHMAKNSEWGAVVYLSQSRYGKYGNTNYGGVEKEVMINNCSNFITGIGADKQNDASSTSACTTNTYETSKGQAASTTGNITGIYDMSGGAWECVMGYLSGVSDTWGATNSNNFAGFTSAPNKKYYDTYISSDPTSNIGSLSETVCDGGICYGHSLSETSGWYADDISFLTSRAPWFRRGGRYSSVSTAGMFGFSVSDGYSSNINSFRVVMS